MALKIPEPLLIPGGGGRVKGQERRRRHIAWWSCKNLTGGVCPFTVFFNTDKPIDIIATGFNCFHAEITLSGGTCIFLIDPFTPTDTISPLIFNEITLATLTAVGSPWRILWGRGSGEAQTDGMNLPYFRIVFRNNSGTNSVITIDLWADWRD
jgi:hypothetical protein